VCIKQQVPFKKYLSRALFVKQDTQKYLGTKKVRPVLEEKQAQKAM
jgi:hypothetical protein